MKKNTLILLIATNCIFLQTPLLAQLKTKIFPTGLSKDLIKQSFPLNEIFVAAPSNFEALKKSGSGKENLSDYKNKFAEIVNVDYNLLTTAKQFNTDNKVLYSMKLNADKALNISLQFSEFHLSPNAVLQLRTDFEITEDITEKENNTIKIWATRIYQGSVLYITLSVPQNEISEVKVKINKIGFGFRQISGGFFGTPGNSGNCNINVLCPPGNGWENERNSVALIVSGGNEICTGTLVMNACGTNVPYLLTANHCLNSTVANWVFQFQTWSTDCLTNTGWREDVQFNGCQLRANNAATDFALVELNQTPQANSGLRYSGWTRDPNPAITTTSIHHPSGDLMKISHDFQPPVSVPWPGFDNHWRAIFNQGIVQHGSSGSALYDENHRILGQLHGNQNNFCNIGDNNCFCTIQLPSIGEYGRFDISWTGGGTNTTRLSNWLDPNNTGLFNTNTTAIQFLAAPPAINLTINGSQQLCLNSTNTQTLAQMPPVGTVINWSINDPNVIITPSPNGLSCDVDITNAATNVWYQLTVTTQNTCPTISYTKHFYVPIVGWAGGITGFQGWQNPVYNDNLVEGENYFYTGNGATYFEASVGGAYGYPLNGVWWEYVSGDYTSFTNQYRIGYDLSNYYLDSYYNLHFGDDCGSHTVPFHFMNSYSIPPSYKTQPPKELYQLKISPNPAFSFVNISVVEIKSNKKADLKVFDYNTQKVVKVYDKLGNLLIQSNEFFPKSGLRLNISMLKPSDLYNIIIEDRTGLRLGGKFMKQ